MYLTGRQSKLAKLMEDAIREQRDVEVEMVNGEVHYGKIDGYELSANHFIVTLKKRNNMLVINFQHVIRIRLKRETQSGQR